MRSEEAKNISDSATTTASGGEADGNIASESHFPQQGRVYDPELVIHQRHAADNFP
jgi:hypothetical protein